MSNLQTYNGKNGVTAGDNGTSWRAFGSPDIADPQVFDYIGHDGKKNGVKYAMGFDSKAGKTRLAYIDYPKDLYSVEEVINGEDTPFMLMNCNVCHATDQAAAAVRSRGVSSPSQFQSSQSSPRDQRLSVGPAAASVLPKYGVAAIRLAKAFALRPTGDAAVSLTLSFLADLASGFLPQFQQSLQAFSDEMVDDLTPDVINRIKEDSLAIADAALSDGDALLSRKRVLNSMFKSRGDIRREVEDSKRSVPSSQRSLPSGVSSPSFTPSPPNQFYQPLRLYE